MPRDLYKLVFRSLTVHFRKAFQQETIREALRWTKPSFMDEMFGRNLVLFDKTVESRFCDCKDECLT